MRITAIEISNFRQYRHLDLSFNKIAEHDLHIVVADNGVGKTNILNAITWCLYGDEPHLGNASKSLPRLNLQTKREAEASGKDVEDISVKISIEDDGSIIQFERYQKVRLVPKYFEGDPDFSVRVFDKGLDGKIHKDQEAIEYVEKYMPKKIRQYFYFDGEQLDSYFISDDSAKIRQTIHAISQVDVVTRVKERLHKIVSLKQQEAGKKAPNIQKINSELKIAEKEIGNIMQQIEVLNRQIIESQKIIKENTEHLSGQENLPDLEIAYQKLLKNREQLKLRKDKAMKQMFSFVKEMKIAISLYSIAKNTLDIINEKDRNHALPPDIDKRLLQSILIKHECFICGQALQSSAEDRIREILDKIQVSSETSNILMLIRNELKRIVELKSLYEVKKEEVFYEFKNVSKEIESCEQELQSIDNQISKFSDKEKIIEWHNERKKHMELLEGNKQKLNIQEFCLKEKEDNKIAIESDLNKELSKQTECKKMEKQITFIKKSEEIVLRIEQEMMAEVRDKMQSRTMEFFSELIWKQGVYDHITLDDKYQLDLMHHDGYSCVGSCSAAERSLLALAFTLALHEVSGFNAILFIDTPVARVSGPNRINFANVLKKVSKEKQLIMTFAPDEYSDNVRNVFAPIASTSQHLRMNSEKEITTIEGGYNYNG